MSLKNQLSDLVAPVVESFGFELWGLQYVPHGTSALLRIFIDGPDGVNVEDCAKVSRQLSAVLDVEDPIAGKYILEISSPGLDRPLFVPDQFKRYLQQTIKVKTNSAIDKRRKFKGQLVSVSEDDKKFTLEIDGENFDIEFLNIDKANVVGDIALLKNKSQKNH